MPAATAATATGQSAIIPAFDAEVLALAEKRLAQYIGPLAKILAKKTVKNATSIKALYQQPGEQIENENDRKAFLKLGDKTN